ncbi:hypothetical protein, partial [Thiolapillus sp.]
MVTVWPSVTPGIQGQTGIIVTRINETGVTGRHVQRPPAVSAQRTTQFGITGIAAPAGIIIEPIITGHMISTMSYTVVFRRSCYNRIDQRG